VTNFPEARCDHSEQAAAVWSLGSGMRLMRRNLLVKTGPVDFAEWNSRPLLGWISRQRFRLVVSLLPKAPIVRLLEIGYGSGIFLPASIRPGCSRGIREGCPRPGENGRPGAAP
jgi:hypothetical protein